MNKEFLSLRGLPILCGLVLTLGLWLLPLPDAGAAGCPNEAFRTGPSADLPDCRGYELVTPADSNGRLVEGLSTFGFGGVGGMFPTELGSRFRDSFVYESYNGPMSTPEEATGTYDIYQAARSEGGWGTVRRLSPSGEQAVSPFPGGVSQDHLYSFTKVSPGIQGHPGGTLAAESSANYLSAPDGSFELVGSGSLGSERLAEGRYISVDGEHVIFTTGNLPGQTVWCRGAACPEKQLEPDAAPTGTGAIYDREADGETKVISLLPGGVPAAAGEEAFYQGTSKDASTVAFKINTTLYVRGDNAETLKVTEAESTYAGLSDDGRYLFYVTDLEAANPDRGNIHRFDTEEEKDEQVSFTGDAEVVNVSADGSHVYFVSETKIGGKGEAGKPNLYVWSGGTTGFVATVSPEDTTGIPALTKWTSWAVNPERAVIAFGGPGADSSRTTPDGTVLAFQSRAELTGYDNDGHTEIYRFEEGEGLECLSCNQPGPATADARFQELKLIKPAMVVHNLSADGSRVFFETPEALVARDTDGINDIYQWHTQEGEAASIDLISTGKSVDHPSLVPLQTETFPLPNILFSITPDGEDVFFLAMEELVPAAGGGGTQAIYDARVNGGFAEPAPPVICLEEDCKGPFGAPPSLPGPPSSEGTHGAGNVPPPKHKPHCQRPKHKKHKHCKKKKAAKRRASARASATSSEAPSSSTRSASATSAPESSSVAGEASAASVSATASEEFPFGIEVFEVSESTPAAAMHPDFTTRFVLPGFLNKENGRQETDARLQEASFTLPPGLLGNVNAIPKCETGELVAGFGDCPLDSQVGLTQVVVSGLTDAKGIVEPVFNMEPPYPEREIARFGFIAHSVPVFVDVKVDTAGDYHATATVHQAPGQGAVLRAKTTLWANPPDPAHDKQRFNPFEAGLCGGACPPEGNPSNLPPTAFLTNPSACQPMSVGLQVKSYQRPGEIFTKEAEMEPITECQGLPFAPAFQAAASNPTTSAPSGLKTTLVIPQQSTEAVNSPSTATMREARVTLPKGFQVNPGAADGIAACSEEEVGYRREIDENCLDASKVGVATIQSPLLPHPIGAEIFLRNQRPGHPFGLWLASDELGLHIKIPGELEPDKGTGQLTAVFTDLPQTPVSEIDLEVWGGARAPLTTPEDCGTYNATWFFKPHSEDPAVTGTSPIAIDQGCGARGFSPRLHAGTTNPIAGAYSPFEFDLVREDTEQNLASLDLTLPDGLLGKPAGVPLCPEAQAATGNCPAETKIGSVSATAGPGTNPISIPQPGKAPTAVYWAGPYKGAPYSILAVVPAQAGPFDLGNVVVRSALQVDPETARATVASDPLPQFFEGVGVIYRRVHVGVDRPEFILNPTDCSELAIASHLVSVKGAVAEPSSRFQVDGCKALKYSPKLKLELKGGTKRSDHPAVKAVLTQASHQANTAKATVLLPSSEFIDQDHINSPCTRVQFKEEKCPKLSVLGRATATTPLLDQPLSGPVYFRSNGGERELPDIVADLRGQIHVTIVGFVDAVPIKGTERSRIRTRFANVPDAPVSKFTMNLLGGKKRGLLENSRDLCQTDRRAKVILQAQNGLRSDRNLLIETGCKGKGKGRRR